MLSFYNKDSQSCSRDGKDISLISNAFLEERFPNIYNVCECFTGIPSLDISKKGYGDIAKGTEILDFHVGDIEILGGIKEIEEKSVFPTRILNLIKSREILTKSKWLFAESLQFPGTILGFDQDCAVALM